MKLSWKIARLFGIDLHVHVTFLIVPLMVAFIALTNGSGIIGLVSMMTLVMALFMCVVLHEYGHALTAKLFGIQTRDITLLPIGGLARLEDMPRKPWHEFWIAIAGPMVNVVIAFILGVILFATGGLSSWSLFPTANQGLLASLFSMNVVLVLFNMLPAFPMDGGRVLRSLLATVLSYEQATLIATRTGQFMAVALGLFGLLIGNPTLPFIAAFVFLGANAELHQVTQQAAFERMWGRGGPGNRTAFGQMPFHGNAGRFQQFGNDPNTIDSTARPVSPDGAPTNDDPTKPPVRAQAWSKMPWAKPMNSNDSGESDNLARSERVETIYLPNGGFINIIHRG